MAADCCNGFLTNAVIRELIERSSQNLTHTSRKLLLSGLTSKFALLKIQDDGRPPYGSSIQYHNSQCALPIFKKFDIQMRKNIFVMLVTFNTRYLQIQYGGRPPCWICIKCDNLETA
jgi:hypothetical protein